ncbi:MAG: response regulator transcription factor [Bryobacteraceae bacterium]|nr:response regulator transcription factor [Bryobacteraceae bacterium]
MSKRILVVEDEPGLRLTLCDRLRSEGYEVESAAEGQSGLALALDGVFDTIILDVMLPNISGFDICRRVRQRGKQTPILMLSARGEVVDKVAGLQFGADDYVAKPFEFAELLARIEALLRRAALPNTPSGATEYSFGDIRVDFKRTEVTRNGEPVPLSAREFHLLRYLIEHRDETLDRDVLLKEVWGYTAAIPTRTLDVHVAWLRQKLEPNPKTPVYILTVRGFGYKFEG